jgi:hypothetical protein
MSGRMDCRKGHKPRFYLPKEDFSEDCGWKRRCNEFRPHEPKTE